MASILTLLILLVPGVAFAADAVTAVIPTAQRMGGWAAVAGFVIFILTQLQKTPAFGAWLQKVPRALRILLPLVLSAICGLLASWLDGMDIKHAAMTAFYTLASAVLQAEAFSQATGTRSGPAPSESTKVGGAS